MKKIAAAAAIALAILTSAALVSPVAAMPLDKKIDHCEKCKDKRGEEFKKDPIKFLEEKKSRILKLMQEGKIDKDVAQKAIEKIDKKIEEIKEFQNLPLEKKREVLINKYKDRMAEMVKKGKIKQDEADKRMKEFIEKINSWDGSGYPIFHHKR